MKILIVERKNRIFTEWEIISTVFVEIQNWVSRGLTENGSVEANGNFGEKFRVEGGLIGMEVTVP